MKETMKKNKNLEPELRPEYIKKIKKIQHSGNYTEFSSIEQLRAKLEKKEKRIKKKAG